MATCKKNVCQPITMELEEGVVSSKSWMARYHHVLKDQLKGLGHSSLVEHLPKLYKDLSYISKLHSDMPIKTRDRPIKKKQWKNVKRKITMNKSLTPLCFRHPDSLMWTRNFVCLYFIEIRSSVAQSVKGTPIYVSEVSLEIHISNI